MQRILGTLKDIPGVVGSFVLTEDGVLLAREMPAVYPDTIFADLGRRLRSMKEALQSQVNTPFAEMLLKFDAYWLLCRRTDTCMLSVLTTDAVNYPALKMASNVALKQIEAKVPAALALHAVEPLIEEEEAPAPVTPAEPLPAATAPAPRTRRFWRGQAVD